jgi:hypothetical protein
MKLGRNDPCHCGSGEKYKKCCLPKDEALRLAELDAKNRQAEEQAREPSASPAAGAARHPAAPAKSQPQKSQVTTKRSPIRRRAV